MSVVRGFSPLEHSYLALDHGNYSPVCNQYVVEGVGAFSQLEWKSAIEEAVEKNPGIALKLKGRWAWRYWSNSGRVPEIKIYKSAWNGRDSNGAEFDGQKLNCYKGNVAEIHLIEGKIPKVVFRTHHAVMDGNATLFWMKEVFRALRGEPLLGSRCDLNENYFIEQFSPVKGERPTFAGPWPALFPKKNVDIEFQRSENLSENCVWRNILFARTSEKPLAKVIEFLHQQFQKKSSLKPIIRIPTDLRRLLEAFQPESEQKYPLSNCVSAFDFEIDEEDNEARIYRKIFSGIHKRQDILLFPKLYQFGRFIPKQFFVRDNAYYKALYENNNCDISAIVTHVGKVSLLEFSYPGFTATNVYAIPVPLEGVSFSCVLLEHEQGLSACISAPKAYADAKELNRIAKKMAEYFSQS